jgi:hypothetical protein
MSELPDLLLIATDSGDVEARLTATPTGEVTITGPGEAAARAILGTYVRTLGVGEPEALAHLGKVGWSNGPLALIHAQDRPTPP